MRYTLLEVSMSDAREAAVSEIAKKLCAEGQDHIECLLYGRDLEAAIRHLLFHINNWYWNGRMTGTEVDALCARLGRKDRPYIRLVVA